MNVLSARHLRLRGFMLSRFVKTFGFVMVIVIALVQRAPASAQTVRSGCEVAGPVAKLPSSNTRAEFLLAAHSEAAVGVAQQACGNAASPEDRRRAASGSALAYAMAADFYRCAQEAPLAKRYEQRARRQIARAGPASSSQERQQLKMTRSLAAPPANGGCWWSKKGALHRVL